jgi:hypothetical protein
MVVGRQSSRFTNSSFVPLLENCSNLKIMYKKIFGTFKCDSTKNNHHTLTKSDNLREEEDDDQNSHITSVFIHVV